MSPIVANFCTLVSESSGEEFDNCKTVVAVDYLVLPSGQRPASQTALWASASVLTQVGDA
jgi:hypothetical protein